MSWFSSSPIREQRSGTASIEVQQGVEYEEHILLVHYEYSEWSEGHPCGEGTAYERLSDVTICSYELDGESATQQELVKRFGQEQFDKAVSAATDNY